MKRLLFYITNRFVFFILCLVIFVGVNYLYTKQFLPSTSTKDIWFYSGLFMILFSVLFIEPFYTSPKNVISNAIPLLLVYLSIRDSFVNPTIWWISISVILALILFSIISMSVYNPSESEDSSANKFANWLKELVVLIGQGKVIYSIVFLSILFLYKYEILKDTSESFFFVLILIWGLILLINPQHIHNKFADSNTKKNSDAIGDIFSVQSNRMFLVKLFEDRKSVKKFDVVKFRYLMDEESNRINRGFIFDTYNLNRERWVKIILLSEANENFSKLKSNTVYKVNDREEKVRLENELRIESFVGVVIEGSKIGNIKFEYSKKNNDLQEGDLLELIIGAKIIFYQVVAGLTAFEKLENKDESGIIEGEALQLGTWDNVNLSFEKFGWVPEINTPLFTAKTDNIVIPQFALPEYKLGVIPNTHLPSVINLKEAVSHHIALLGVTGAGKSFIAKDLIEQLRATTKVICIDFTGEWKKLIQMQSLNAANLDAFLAANTDEIGLVELPVVSNTVGVIQSTETFISRIFAKAKEAFDANTPMNICLVLEEAHTIVPEGTFLGVNDWDSKAVVNKMGQVALQGRKFGVGLMVIAQRTANVSKTVLTQCNTIICFQAFDETSFTFLGNYIGKDLVQALPNLKKYHAVVTGKAIKSRIPMIVNLERQP